MSGADSPLSTCAQCGGRILSDGPPVCANCHDGGEFEFGGPTKEWDDVWRHLARRREANDD